MMFTEDFPRTTVSTYSEESDSNSNDSSSNDILQFYGLQCQNTNSMDNFVAEILSELEVRDFQRKNEKKSNRNDKCSRKMKELKIVLKRIDNKNKSFIIKENLSNSKKFSQTNELKIVLKRIGSDNKSFIVKEKLSKRKKVRQHEGKMKKDHEMHIEKQYFDLPYGWTKLVVTSRNQLRMKGKPRVDIYLMSPGIKKQLRSDIQLMKFLKENPAIQCDLDATSTSTVKHRELLNRSFAY